MRACFSLRVLLPVDRVPRAFSHPPHADRYLEIEKHNGLLLSRLSKIAERKGVEGAETRPGKALQPGEAHPIVSKTYQNRKCARNQRSGSLDDWSRLSRPFVRLPACRKEFQLTDPFAVRILF